MIIFKKLRYMNFISAGNNFTEILLNKSKSTLILGKNGSGKSSILDALMFVLYNRPFRNINKPQLVNSITQKNLLVEIEFSIGNKEYLIRRGIKPSIFEIIVNGSLLNQNADSKEYQDFLEKHILKMNYKSFTQIVVLGSANYMPFMQLSASERRSVIEDLLDIQVFSTMNTLLKERASKNKQEISEIESQIALQAQKIELSEKHQRSLRSNKQEQIDSKLFLISEAEESIIPLEKSLDSISDNIQSLTNSVSDKDKISTKKNKALEIKTKLSSKISNLKSEIEFFKENDDCPTCKQSITEEFKTSTIQLKSNNLQEVEDGLGAIQKEYDSLESKISQIHNILERINSLNREHSRISQDIKNRKNSILSLRNEIKLINDRNKEEIKDIDLESFRKDLSNLQKSKESSLNDRELLTAAAVLLKDTGIKTRIVKQYVPIINQLVNKYLSSLDFFVNFDLDEKFVETIRSRHRDEFSYASFSEGEKFRIDVSLMLTWRAIAKMRNSASTNLLIMDEVFDSSLDSSGTDDFLKILETLGNETNVFVISHKGDTLYDKFHSVIQFVKNKNFSQIGV